MQCWSLHVTAARSLPPSAPGLRSERRQAKEERLPFLSTTQLPIPHGTHLRAIWVRPSLEGLQ